MKLMQAKENLIKNKNIMPSPNKKSSIADAEGTQEDLSVTAGTSGIQGHWSVTAYPIRPACWNTSLPIMKYGELKKSTDEGIAELMKNFFDELRSV